MILITRHNSTFCQLQTGETPTTRYKSLFKASIPELELKSVLKDELCDIDQREGIDNRIAVYEDVNIDILESGGQITHSDTLVYLYKVIAPKAQGISLYFNDFELSKGTKVFVYSPNYSQILGAFTSNNNKSYKTLAVEFIHGNEAIIEVIIPVNQLSKNSVKLGSIGKAYKSLSNEMGLKSSDFIDINCPEGADWQLYKHSVAKMYFMFEGAGYLCSGALINNTRLDGTPYFLTAAHCINANTVANTLITYFDYETTSCGGEESIPLTLSGATLKATLLDTDATLLLLDEAPGPQYQPYYCGWDVRDIPAKSASSIHHPAGAPKKISLEFNQVKSYPFYIYWQGDVFTSPNSHWAVNFNVGAVLGGSSGSPLFNSKGRIIGQLHGGNTINKYYGKFSQSWDSQNGIYQQLKYWLDPDNSGITVLDGYIPAGNQPDAAFKLDFNPICVDSKVQLVNKSLFNPDSYLWSISPDSYSYATGSGPTSKNPEVIFHSKAFYDISLTAKKGSMEDEQFQANALRSSDQLNINPFNTETANIHQGGIDTLIVNGASSLEYRIENELSGLIEISPIGSNTASIKLNAKADTSGYLKIPVTIVGTHGSCIDSNRFTVEIPLNDDIFKSHKLEIGYNGPFSNNYATSQSPFEAYPEIGDCETQSTWCACETGNRIIDNSLWFSFTAPESGNVGFETQGFDNQIAIYDTDNPEWIITGKSANYEIIAANDDYSGKADMSAYITNAQVIPGKEYLLQVDGSACGASGTFSIIMIENENSGVYNSLTNNSALIFPNPFSDEIKISSPEAIYGISIYTLQGTFVKQIQVNKQTELTVNGSNLKNGLYFIQIQSNTKTYNHSLLKIE